MEIRLLDISGPDARSFVQGQLTQDIRRLDDSPALLAAWCNPGGRVISVVRVIQADGGVGLVLPASLAQPVASRLAMYRFRAKVEFALQDDEWTGLAVSDESDLSALAALDLLPEEKRNAARSVKGLVAVDPGASPRFIEVYGRVSTFRERKLDRLQAMSGREWLQGLIRAGVPLIDAGTTEKYTPHMLNLDCLDAISFKKGCYTGQEIVARTEHLGSSNRRAARFETDAEVPAGAKLRHGERDVGEVLMSAGDELLAVVPVELHGETLEINGKHAAPRPLPYDLPSRR
ncbi:MAG: hypothetical protein WD448_12895 [Woeseia sp.]